MGSKSRGFARKNPKRALIIKQKLTIRRIHNMKARDHTHNYFVSSNILKFDNLFEHTTISYIQSDLHHTSPNHIQQLWAKREDTTSTTRNLTIILLSHLGNGSATYPQMARHDSGTMTNSQRILNLQYSKRETRKES